MTTSTAVDERTYVRELAQQVADVAHEQRSKDAIKRWKDVNALRKPDRAPVWCRPVGAWSEILPESALRCSDKSLRNWERQFRRALFKYEVADDEPFYPWIGVAAAFDVDPPNRWGLDVVHTDSGVQGGAWAYSPPLKDEADFEKLRLPTFTYNPEATQRRIDSAEALLGDIFEVHQVCDAPLGATLGTAAADLRGMNEMMLDMAMQPEVMHRLMGHLRDGVLKAMDEVEAAGVLTPNNHGPMTCSDPVGEPRPDGTYGYENMWISCNSQEFDVVSPEMWEEFCLNYQRPIIERFGLSCYGCCESLTQKMDKVLDLPNLRIFVCSAWTDLDKVIEKADRDVVIMWRQKASDVVFPDDSATIRRDLEEGARRLQGLRYQIVLRELETLDGHDDRLHVWSQMAREAAAKFS
jgi:hypothetical protein